MKKYIKIIIIMLLVLFLDILSKLVICKLINPGDSIKIIDNFFRLTLVYNYGAAWSILNNQTLFLIIVSFLAIILLIFMIIKEKKLTNLNNIFYGLILGGIFGNLLNRLIFGYVIDFLDFKIFNYNFPTFNIADSAIVISIILMCIEVLKNKE